jgi:hypothetical protein
VTLVLVAAFLALAWWQVRRAGEGNLRSYAYAVEWPVFAGFVVFMWLREVRQARAAPARDSESGQIEGHTEQPDRAVSARTRPERGAEASTRPADDDGNDELAAYNRMLAWLNANPQRRMSDYPG